MNERQLEVLVELHQGLDRLGPGGAEFTRQAYDRLPGLAANPRILDLGCGAGAQTLELAKLSRGSILAVDLFPVFLDRLAEKVREEGLGDRVSLLRADVGDLDLEPESFDLIWSEGVIDIIGLEKSLAAWRAWLKPGGFLAVTQACWFKPDPPAEIQDLWTRAGVEMRDTAACLEALERAGYKPVGSFRLPESAWRQGYYGPLAANLARHKASYSGDQEALEVIRSMEEEMALYDRYSVYYGYLFNLGRKPVGAGRG